MSASEIEMMQRLKKIHDINKELNPYYKSRNHKQSKNHKIDIQKIRNFCVTKHGLVNEDIRRKVWPLLLNTQTILDNNDVENLA